MKMMQDGCGVATTSSSNNQASLYSIKVKEECTAADVQQPKIVASSPPRAASSSGTTMAIGATITIVNGDAESDRPHHHHHRPHHHQQPVDLDLKSKGKPTDSTANKTPTVEIVETSRTPSPKQRSRTPEDAATTSLKTESADSPNPDTPAPARSSIASVFAGHEKLKRYLGTFIQFAMDLGPEPGDTVRTLVLELLSESMTAEEFHTGLQEATNFPLRGFVLPYLKETLPSLQRDLNAAARAENQSCGQYLRSNEAAVLEAVGLAPSDSVERPFADPAPGTASGHHYPRPTPTSHLAYPVHGIKRRASDLLYYENGTYDESSPYPKRWAHPSASLNHSLHHQASAMAHPSQHHATDLAYCWYPAIGQGPSVPSLVQIGGQQSALGYGPPPAPISHLPLQHSSVTHSGTTSGALSSQNGAASLENEWKNVPVMLDCIGDMAGKTKRAVAILLSRGSTSPAAAAAAGPTSTGSSSQTNGAGQPSASNGTEVNGDKDGTFKRLLSEIMKVTEERVAEVKREVEEAVQEVKRAAVAEVKRAVAVAMAESRASEARLRGHRYLDNPPVTPAVVPRNHLSRPFLRFNDSRTATTTTPSVAGSSASSSTTSVEELDKESHLPTGLSPGCWNCGRPALETCGGCGVARYCGSFCQHRDWEVGGHHTSCGSSNQQDRARSTTVSPPRRSVPDQVTSATKSAVARAVK